MAGVKKFKLDAYLSGLTVSDYAQGIFKQTWDFFKQLEVAGHVVEVARNNGSGGTGTDFWDGANPFGPHAWYVFRYPPSSLRTFSVYVLFQYTNTNNFGNISPGSPAKINGVLGSASNIHLAFSVAIAYDSMGNSVNPWGGTTGSLGSDTKGSPVWVKPVGGSLYVLPRSNSLGGSFSTLREDMCGFYVSAPSPSRLYCIGDQDNFSIVLNRANATTENVLLGFGTVIPALEVTIPCPVFQFGQNNTGTMLNRTSAWGGLTTGLTPSGGASINESTEKMSFGWELSMERVQPNAVADTPNSYGLYPISVTGKGSRVGYADPEFWRASYGLLPKDIKTTSLDWMIYGETVTANTVKIALPWDTVTATRGVSTTRDGIIS